jgi:pimeloyl-ACP methyl ester carboxylesterase
MPRVWRKYRRSAMSVAWVLVLVACVAAAIAVSYAVEALRSAPLAPDRLSWAPDIPVRYADIGGGVKLRYIRAGSGPNLVLLHTLRTQLDLFEKVVPALTKSFTVYALDYPGHGYSDIPRARYDADFFVCSVEGFLIAHDLEHVTLCGVSLGASIALIMAGRRNPRVARVIAINPYDYAKGRGMARSSLLGRLIVTTSEIPLLGEFIMRLRNFVIMKAVLRGGVANPDSIRPALLKEMYEVGNRSGHYRAFISLLRNARSWEAATEIYRSIEVPVCLVWGEGDWALPRERDHHLTLIPGAQVVTVENGGHFLPLDRPRELTQLVVRFAGD